MEHTKDDGSDSVPVCLEAEEGKVPGVTKNAELMPTMLRATNDRRLCAQKLFMVKAYETPMNAAWRYRALTVDHTQPEGWRKGRINIVPDLHMKRGVILGYLVSLVLGELVALIRDSAVQYLYHPIRAFLLLQGCTPSLVCRSGSCSSFCLTILS